MEKVVTKVRVGGSATPQEDLRARRRRSGRSAVERKRLLPGRRFFPLE
jgi:hypothetical protein